MRIPKPGDTLDIGPYQARVLTMTRRSVGQVYLTPRTQEQARQDGPGTT